MADASTYEEWKTWALAEDQRTGSDLWKQEDRTSLYDYKVIRRRYDELVAIRRSGDLNRLLFYLNEGLHGNMAGMGAPGLYRRARFGTKALVTAYVRELARALEDVQEADAGAIPLREKRRTLERARDCFGRSALMLSGAGSLGAFHLGVVKALAEQDLIPNVVSGASAGSLVAAMIGTHGADELAALLTPSGIATRFSALRGPRLRGRRRKRLALDDLHGLIDEAIPDLTFGEALEETGQRINVAVAPATLHQRSRLLNASTSPNAYIREAVLASCAIPGIFPPVTLAARDAFGKRAPYVPSRQWVDGSITDDQPARRLARLYGVNHFITSQANPIALWISKDPHRRGDLAGRLADVARASSREGLRTLYPFAMHKVRNLYPLNTWLRLWFSVVTQDYSADVNIVLNKRIFDPSILLARLSHEEFESLVRDGERATWPRIEQIRNCTEVSRAIDRVHARLQGPSEPRPRSSRATPQAASAS